MSEQTSSKSKNIYRIIIIIITHQQEPIPFNGIGISACKLLNSEIGEIGMHFLLCMRKEIITFSLQACVVSETICFSVRSGITYELNGQGKSHSSRITIPHVVNGKSRLKISII